ncbi:alpha-l-rhamnosidase [Colletotrichum truncatum]|uniref:Alpha-l-rhamnosidase n=1 Tax=Colletotrichum truncatum TaxID=5467 RepID=A0ACC3Z1Z5_COLTU|nr:alpha-l-rhamnosidase [Colletotrichum truncatum]KAF6780920.1 alpha-l-rhamnosidase [Colletotrichum truncatum]
MAAIKPELIVPERVLSASASAQLDADSGILTLCNDRPSATAVNATIVLDYGRCIGGLPIFTVDRANGQDLITLQVVYSETIEGIDCETGDGPFFLFSNAMDSYRSVSVEIKPSDSQQVVRSTFTQRSQRYIKLVLLSPETSVVISKIGIEMVRPLIAPKASFYCSDESLNLIWKDGVRTIDACTVLKGETAPSWEVTATGTRIPGQHWAPCRRGTRWGDKEVSFEVLAEQRGASWGVHMVANGIIFCLDTEAEELRAYEGLSDQPAVFPVKRFGSWSTHGIAKRGEWVKISTVAIGSVVTVTINDREVTTISDAQVRPILGGSAINTGSVAFGGPNGWRSVYRNLVVKSPDGEILYENDMQLGNKDRILSDFQVGTNAVSCMIDGAKRDRATFGGDLFVSGRGVAYARLDIEAVAGSIRLLASHQTAEGYLGNLCPIQAPIHTGDEPPPTYAFYSITYAFLLVVAAKDYWLHSGDDKFICDFLPAAEKLLTFAESHLKPSGLIEAPPELSMHWYPMGGPIFGASGTTNLAYYDALNAIIAMTSDAERKTQLAGKAQTLKESILACLWNPETRSIRMGMALPSDGICQDTNGYALHFDSAYIACWDDCRAIGP